MTLKLNGTNSEAAPAYAGDDADTGLQCGTNELKLVTGGSARATVNSSGNFGIGTTSPGEEFVVRADAPSIQLESSNANGRNYGFQSMSDGKFHVYDGTAGANRVTLDSSGRVLIGATSSTYTNAYLQVHGANSNTYISMTNTTEANTDGSGYNYIHFRRRQSGGAESSSARIGSAHDGTLGNEKGRLMFFTNDGNDGNSPTERMRINSGGTVTIGSGIISDNDNGEGLLFTSGGFIRLGNITGSGSASMAQFKTGSGNTEVLRFRCDGDLENYNNRYGAISDANLKENIVDAGSQWDDIKNIRVRKYNFRGDLGYNTHTQIGVIAQELEQTCPGLVGDSYDLAEDGSNLETSRKSVSYSVLYMKAVKALQEAQTRIETLETQNTAQQAQIDDLLARVTALEAAS